MLRVSEIDPEPVWKMFFERMRAGPEGPR
jgi:hypothetical protein